MSPQRQQQTHADDQSAIKPPSAVIRAASPVPSHRAIEDVEVPDDPADVFDELVATNDRICQQCFRRHTRRDGLDERDLVDVDGNDKGDRLAGVSAYVDYHVQDDADDVFDREYFEDVSIRSARERAAHPADPPAKTSTACAHCGTIDWHRKPDTWSRERAIDAAAGLSVTLEEYGVVHDWLRLLAAVGRLKRLPATAGDDHATFSRAVEFAIRRA